VALEIEEYSLREFKQRVELADINAKSVVVSVGDLKLLIETARDYVELQGKYMRAFEALQDFIHEYGE
jgi:hypothetical protein